MAIGCRPSGTGADRLLPAAIVPHLSKLVNRWLEMSADVVCKCLPAKELR